jgi:predicted enzyme involved in methoxymalonyl-ACP biosynthesis
LLARARRLGYGEIIGEYLPTKKNALVRHLYDDLGFRRKKTAEDRVLYAMEVAGAGRPLTYLVPGEAETLVQPA